MSDLFPRGENLTLFGEEAIGWFVDAYAGGALVLSSLQGLISAAFDSQVPLRYAVVTHEDDLAPPYLIVEVSVPVDDPAAWAALSSVTAAFLVATDQSGRTLRGTFDAIVLTLGGAPRNRRSATRRGMRF